MSLLRRFFSRERDERAVVRPLYDAIVAEARTPAWYLEGAAPDTLDGRFDMVALVLAFVLLRLEREGDGAARESSLLTETFIDDMDGQLRQIGIGDLLVGKHVGRMMSALGGRLAAYRAALGGGADLGEALVRNLWRGEAPPPMALAFATARARSFWASLGASDVADILAGRLPAA
jgi:cytochrome b pre-mRNA-processing protein 3